MGAITKPALQDAWQPDPTITANQTIRRSILAEDRRLKAAHPWLKHQDLIGAGILGAVVLMMTLTALAFLNDAIPGILAVISMAFAMSIAHEMEHDLIHNLYFSSSKKMHAFAMGLIWVIKLHANPYWRRLVHIRHHSHSGQNEDWEERLIGLGQPFGWRRIVATVYPFGAVLFIKSTKSADPTFSVKTTRRANMPAAIVFHLLTNLQILDWVLPAEYHEMVPNVVWSTVSALVVLWVLPSILRHACLSLVTTAVHYSDDIPRGNVHFENQILDHWAFVPLQLFCFNFGATHIVHHYITPQPFYIRHLVAIKVHGEMIAAGCRHNDLAILSRANRWSK